MHLLRQYKPWDMIVTENCPPKCTLDVFYRGYVFPFTPGRFHILNKTTSVIQMAYTLIIYDICNEDIPKKKHMIN